MSLTVLHTPGQVVQWLRERGAGSLTVDSRQASPGSAFIAWPGAAVDGRRFVPDALAQGAVACLVEAQGAEAWLPAWQSAGALPSVAVYEGLKAATGFIASAWLDEPSQALDVLAVTGTNGKTSTAWWLAQALSSLPAQAPATVDRACGFVGTLGIGQPPNVRYTGLTTPDPVSLHQAFEDFRAQGLRACAIEASSIGLAERRLDGVRIKMALYTNFSQDHLDYHGNMAAYWEAKAELFAWPGLDSAVINIDDAHGAALAGQLAGREDLALWTYGRDARARLHAQDVAYVHDGLAFSVTEQAAAGDRTVQVNTRLVGEHNVGNLLAVIGGLRALGVTLDDAAQACAGLTPVPGRMACLGGPGQPQVVVDFAHTPDAIEKVLQALRPMAEHRHGDVHIVVGCGGDRDPIKRPLMAETAERLADRVTITSDNPRSEQPMAIVNQMLAGLKNPSAVQVQPDRARAIADAVAQASAADVVLLAGKGHETYQEIAGVRHAFSDLEHGRLALAAWSSRAAGGPA